MKKIKTKEELVEFLNSISIKPKEELKCSNCGLTEREFNNEGKMGCSNCYKDFAVRLESILLAFHKSKEHIGKIPKQYLNKIQEDPVEKIKLLKMQYAKALELEEYEKLSDLKKKIDETNRLL